MNLVVNDAEFRRAKAKLSAFQNPKMTKTLRRAALAGARVMVKPLRAAAPTTSRRPSQPPRNLRRSIRVAYAKRGAARGGVAYIVGPMGKLGFHRHWVIGGTRPHRIKAKGRALATPYGPRASVNHPGSRPNPFVARVGNQVRGQVRAAMIAEIAKATREAR